MSLVFDFVLPCACVLMHSQGERIQGTLEEAGIKAMMAFGGVAAFVTTYLALTS